MRACRALLPHRIIGPSVPDDSRRLGDVEACRLRPDEGVHMRLILVRHGESLGNVTRTMQGRADPLTDRGRSQARAIATHLQSRGDVRTIYASPLARALETSRI